MPTKTKVAKRNLYKELMAGVGAMKAHRKGLLTLRSHTVKPLSVPAISAKLVMDTRSAFHMSRQVFARKIGVNPRTLERWEQGRSKPNDQAAVLLWLLRDYPDTLKRLERHPPRGAA
jgi:putative transcriptional regulator